MQKKDAAAITLMVWMFTVSGWFGMLSISDLGLFAAVVPVGFFVIVYVIHPVFSTPKYMRNLYYMAAAFGVLFGVAITLRILELLRG